MALKECSIGHFGSRLQKVSQMKYINVSLARSHLFKIRFLCNINFKCKELDQVVLRQSLVAKILAAGNSSKQCSEILCYKCGSDVQKCVKVCKSV